MNDERIILAVGRLERALARAEAAAARPAPPPDADLRERHQRLRESTQAAIARLDTLLGPAVDPALATLPDAEGER